MLFGLTPTVGLQTVEVILFALVTRRLFYFNRAAALTVIYISNPLTVAPIYYGLYWVGTCFVAGQATLQQFQQILTSEGFAGWWQAMTDLVTDVGMPLIVGTLVVAPAAAVATYPLTRCLLQWYRGHRPPGKPHRKSEEETSSVSAEESDRSKVDLPHASVPRPRPTAAATRPQLQIPASG